MKRLILILTLLCAVAALADDTVSVEVRGLGEPVEGWLRKVSDSRWILQGPDRYYELDGDDIRSVDGRDGPPSGDAKRIIDYATYEEILPNGDVKHWSSTRTVHRERSPLTYVNWGAHEREMDWWYQDFHLYDVYGNELEVERTRRTGGGYSFHADLKVPICEGETLVLASTNTVSGWSQASQGVWTHNHNGDYPEDRLVVRKVRLPKGAELLEVTPEADVFEHDGATHVVWRRYFPRHVVLPMTITYRLD